MDTKLKALNLVLDTINQNLDRPECGFEKQEYLLKTKKEVIVKIINHYALELEPVG